LEYHSSAAPFYSANTLLNLEQFSFQHWGFRVHLEVSTTVFSLRGQVAQQVQQFSFLKSLETYEAKSDFQSFLKHKYQKLNVKSPVEPAPQP